MIKFFTTVRQALAVAAIAAAGGALVATPAFADVLPTTTTQAVVSYAGLDLSTAAGQASMERRVRAAARQVCGYEEGERDLGRVASRNACVAQAMNGAQRELAAVTGRSTSSQRVAVRDTGRNVPGHAR